MKKWSYRQEVFSHIFRNMEKEHPHSLHLQFAREENQSRRRANLDKFKELSMEGWELVSVEKINERTGTSKFYKKEEEEASVVSFLHTYKRPWSFWYIGSLFGIQLHEVVRVISIYLALLSIALISIHLIEN